MIFRREVIYSWLHDFLTPTKRNFFWMMVGMAVYTVCQWGMVVILTKFGAPDIVGQFALGLAVISPVIMVTNMQLRGVQATDAHRIYPFADYVAVRLISLAVAGGIVFVIMTLAHFEKEIFWVTLILTMGKGIEALSDVFYGLFQQNEQMGYIAKSMILKGVASVAVLGVVFYYSSSLLLFVLALGIVWAVIFMIYDLPIARNMVARVEGRDHAAILPATIHSLLTREHILKNIVSIAFPLGLVMGIVSLNANIPRYAIEKYLGARDLGFFAALSYATLAINMFIQALGQAVSPRLALFFSKGDIRSFRDLVQKLIFLNLAIGISGLFVVWVWGEAILSFVYTKEYAAYSSVFLVLIVATILMGIASVLGYAMTAARVFRQQVPLFVCVGLSTALFSIWLVPSLRLHGAAIALMVSFLVQIAGSFWILRNAVRRHSQGTHEENGPHTFISKKAIRVLHIVGQMNTGGVETWLMHVLRHIDPEKYKFDFLVHTDNPGFYDDEIRFLGGRIFPCLSPKRPLRYVINFMNIIRKNGPYDVIHSHVHDFSGMTLFLSRMAGVPVRIAHSHTSVSGPEGRFLRKLYLGMARFLVHSHATHGLACSQVAATSLFGQSWDKDPRWQIFYCGIDLTAFKRASDRMGIRKDLGIDGNAFVMGHVGRFIQSKNHEFLIDIFLKVRQSRPNAFLLLVGEGPLKEEIEKKVRGNSGLNGQVIFAGVRNDVPRLMMDAMDVFIFPSLWEGLPMVLLEAQAAGLPCVCSDAITDEVMVVDPLISKVSLGSSALDWANVVMAAENKESNFNRDDFEKIVSSPFNIDSGINKLNEIYAQNPDRRHRLC